MMPELFGRTLQNLMKEIFASPALQAGNEMDNRSRRIGHRPLTCSGGQNLLAALKTKSGLLGVPVKHLDGVERIVGMRLAEQRKLSDQVVGGGDDLAAACLRLIDVEHLARAGPKNLHPGEWREVDDGLTHDRHGVCPRIGD